MPPDRSGGGFTFDDRTAARVVAVRTARRAARSGALWGVVFGGYVASTASGYASLYPTSAARTKLATSFGSNAGLAALVGPARRLDTVAGFTAWRSVGVLSVAGAVWGLFLATRLLRGEEDAGRWELYLSGQTTRGGAAAQAVSGLTAGLLALWLVTALITVAVGSTSNVGFSTTGSLFLAVALATGAGMFIAAGTLISQVAADRRSANGIGAAVLGVSYLVRMVADSSSGLSWLRWTNPLGWVEELHPLSGSRPMALVPIAVLMVGASSAALAIASRRDVGAGLLPSRDAPPPRTALLTGPGGLTVRLLRPVAIGWLTGLAIFGFVLGMVAQSASVAISGSATIQRAVARLGGHRGGVAAYLGVALLTAGCLIAFAAAAQVAATRGEESSGHVDNLLVQPIAHTRWLAVRLAAGAGLVVGGSVVTGIASWVGAASQSSGIGLGRLVTAGVNLAPPALFVLGVGAVAYGFVPRAAPTVTYGLVTWSLLVEFAGAAFKNNRWVLDSSIFAHITPAPAAEPDWVSAAVLVGLGVLAAAVGLAAFKRRDLVGA